MTGEISVQMHETSHNMLQDDEESIRFNPNTISESNLDGKRKILPPFT
jgi:hypothetical protein